MLYATDASLYQVEPLGVVIPRTIEEGVEVIAACGRARLPVLPRGGGTSLAGQCTAEAVVVDFSAHCRRIVSIDAASRRCDVEPGVTIDGLNAELQPLGLFFAPDPATSSHANIGGCIANNAAGGRSIRYGRTSENLRSLDIALWDGRRARLAPGSSADDERLLSLTRRIAGLVARHSALIRDRFPKTIRRNAGYQLDLILDQVERFATVEEAAGRINLAPLLCGSEGTLAIILGAGLELHALPRARSLTIAAFETVDAAIGAVGPLLATGPTAVELIDDVIIGLARSSVEYHGYVEAIGSPEAGAVLFIEHSGEPEELDAATDRVRQLVGDRPVRVHRDPLSMADAWKLRKAGEPLLHAARGPRRPLTFVEDNAVPVQRLGEFVRSFRQIMARHGTTGSFWAHASVGVLHVRPFLDLRDPADRERMVAIAGEVADLARSLGGIMSGEHGDGRARSPLLERAYGPELMRAFREVKEIFDPHGLLNPGNIVGGAPEASLAERLRVIPRAGSGEPTAPVSLVPCEPAFDHPGGLLHELELCNGAGLCRRMSEGTMCPSYRALKDERHSTRGRANALRLAGTGQLSPAAWADPELLQTLDLCLSCKACRSECPSGVDLARLKAECLHQAHRRRGKSSREARLVGAAPELLALAARAPRLTNAMASLAPVRWGLERAGLIDRRRSLPRVARTLAKGWRPNSKPGGVSIALFADCFTNHLEPEVGVAARRVLESHGFHVSLVAGACCGRAAISAGMLGRARDRIDRAAARIARVAPAGARLVVLEPSCLSAFRDEWRTLTGGNEARRAVATSAVSLCEALAEAPLSPEMRWEGPAVFHGHCHDRALGHRADEEVLRRVIGRNLARPATGCCGMAGAWGYAPHRFELSMAIARQGVTPAIESALVGDSGCTVIAPGTSCRHQLRDAMGVRALHPAQVLDGAIRSAANA